MPVNSTKQRILDATIQLFNEKGMVNVRLQQIADLAGISVGNLAYHYHSKKAIISAIDKKLSEVIGPIISEKRAFPSLLDFDAQLAHYHHLLTLYSFYFSDMMDLKRAYPKLYQQRKMYIGQIIQQIENWFQHNVDKGRLVTEMRPGHYHVIAHAIWMIINFWMSQGPDYGLPMERERVFKEVIWSQILPYFTEVGMQEFNLMIEPLLDASSPIYLEQHRVNIK